MDCFVLFCVSLFFNGDGYHRDRHVLTHSFPTRRSSDLCRSCTAPPTPAARSAPWAPCSAPARVEPVRSPLFSKDVLDDLVLEHLLGQELLQPSVLGLQLLQALRIGHAHAPELAAPQVVRGFAERSEEHTSDLQSLMRISYAVFCLKTNKNTAHMLTLQIHLQYHT